jgi:hypothetical protein
MRKLLLSMLFGLALAGCGGDEPFNPGSNNPNNPNNAPASQLTIATSAQTIASDGSDAATITAFARDATNNLISNVPVVFTATSGGLTGSTGSTNATGEATATLSTAGDPTTRTITVTATSGTLTATVNVRVQPGGTSTPTVSMGSGTGANFQAGTIGINTPNLSSGGSTSLQVVLQQSDGSLYTQSTAVNFSSPCAAQGLATISSPVTTTTGIATANYAATGCSGGDVITATATAGTQQLSANGTVQVAPGVIGSIIFETATPANVALRGTGTTTNPESSTVVFRVLDQAGGPRVGTTVNFSLNTTVGGISVSPLTAVSGADGRVQTVVQGGTVATTVRVTATVQGVTPVLATQSNQLTVTTGIPDQDSFSLSVQCPNVEAWSRDGVVVAVAARLSDRFNNPVPNGTAITLQAEGGSIVSQCQTGTTPGACGVNWTSSNPRPGSPPTGDPRPGRATILATAIGEESFTDTNGNGSFDNGENFADLPERFLDENENDTRDPTEPIYDFNNNSAYDPVDGIFNGVLCLDTSGRCSAQVTTGISSDALIIMSSGVPAGTTPASGATLAPGIGGVGQSRSYSFRFADLNDNPLPQGTTISFTVSGTGLTLGQPSSFTVPCTTEPTTYPVTAIAGTGATTGTVTVRVLAPSGLETIMSYQVTL